MLENYKNQLPDYAKDLKLNLSSLLNDTTAQLTAVQIASTALACAYATRNARLIEVMADYAKQHSNEAYLAAAKAAASIMAMNNIYYRFSHSITDPEIQKMPAGLRMSIIGNPGIEKSDFELMALAVSILNGCSYCTDAHARVLEKSGVSKSAIQLAAKIAAVMNGLAQVNILES